MSRSPWPLQQDGLLFRDPVESDIEALQSFRNDASVNHFMVRTHVDPDELRRDWLSMPDNPTEYSCVVDRDGDVVAMGFLDVVDGSGQPGHPTGTDGLIGYIVDPASRVRASGPRPLVPSSTQPSTGSASVVSRPARTPTTSRRSRCSSGRGCARSAMRSGRCGTGSSGGWTRWSTRCSTRSGERGPPSPLR